MAAPLKTRIAERIRHAVRSAVCILRNGKHQQLVYRTPDRMCLRCVFCGHSTPGWVVGKSCRG